MPVMGALPAPNGRAPPPPSPHPFVAAQVDIEVFKRLIQDALESLPFFAEKPMATKPRQKARKLSPLESRKFPRRAE